MVDQLLTDLTQDRVMLRTLYAPPPGDFSIVDVPRLAFAILDGEGPPELKSIAAAVKSLYTAIYDIRREARERTGRSFVEAPVEILYWADDMHDLAVGNREKWHWRVQVTLPVWADAARLGVSIAEMREDLDGSAAPRWEALAEGKCVQFLHAGETGDLPSSLRRLYGTYLPEARLEPNGPYHEIYLGDWTRVTPSQRKIIIRQPVLQTN